MKGSINSSEEAVVEMRPSGMLVQKRQNDASPITPSNSTITIKLSYASQQFDLPVPPEFTFGEVKSILSSIIDLEPKVQKLLFRGKEKEDHEYLHLAGVKDNSKMLVMEEETVEDRIPEEVKVTTEISRGAEAVAVVRTEVDKLSEQVSAVQAVVFGGTTVEDKDIICLTEMLMRQLLKLDGIEAEGEGKVQRKMEVRRVQSLVDTMDAVKARNSNPLSNKSNAVSVTTQWETFESGVGSLNPPRPASVIGSLDTPPPKPESVVGSLDAPPPRPAFGVGSLNAPPPVTTSGVASLNPPPYTPASGVGSPNAPPPGPASRVGSPNVPPPRPVSGVGNLYPPPRGPASGVGSLYPPPLGPVSGVGNLYPPPPEPASGVGSLYPPPPGPTSTVGSPNVPSPGPVSGVGSLNAPPGPASGVGSLYPPLPGPASMVGSPNIPPPGPVSGVGSPNPPSGPASGVGSLYPPPTGPASGIGNLYVPPPGPVSGVGILYAPPPGPASGAGSLNAQPLRLPSTVVTEDWEQFE
ncbi:formin-2 [Capsicum galapagoense]